MSALQRAILNTGKRTYAEIWAELYDQGIEISETGIRKAMRALGLASPQEGQAA